MSQLLNRVVKPLVYRNVFRHNNNNMVRWCSSRPTYPYMILDYMLKVAESSDKVKKSFPEQKKMVIKDRAVMDEVCNVMSLTSYDGPLKVGMIEKYFPRVTIDNVDLYIYYKPAKAKSKTVSIRLPHLPPGSVIQNIAMSSYPDLDNEDWVVAIKCNGSQIKLYRPACSNKSRWIDVKVLPETINTSSSLMYSEMDKKFYVPTPGGLYLYSLDPNSKEKDNPKFVNIVTPGVPEHVDHELEELNSSTQTVHFVEGPYGIQFLVKWYFMDEVEIHEGVEKVTRRTREFRVFVAGDLPGTKDKKNLFYSEDIQDLCIFLGHGEPYCVQADSNPGLKPNCIYFMGHDFGIYDITNQCCNLFYTKFDDEPSVPLTSNKFPYWPKPLSLDS